MSNFCRPSRLSSVSPGMKSNMNSGRRFLPGNPLVPEGHVLDGNTVALWRFNNTTLTHGDTIVDEAGNYPLTFNNPSGVEYPYTDYAPVTKGKIGSACQTMYSGPHFIQGPGNRALGDVFNGDWTIEFWFRPTSNYNGVIFTYEGPHAERNYLFPEDVRMAYLRYMAPYLMSGNFTAPNTSFSTLAVIPSPQNAWHHGAASRRYISPGVYEMKTYADGLLGDTLRMGDFETPLTGENHIICVGCAYAESGGGYNYTAEYAGAIDDMRLSNICRTDDEVNASYRRGLEEAL